MGNIRQEESPNWLLVQVYLATSIQNLNSVVTQVFQHFSIRQTISTLEGLFLIRQFTEVTSGFLTSHDNAVKNLEFHYFKSNIA
jgi:hypothetical protein